jgi:ribosome biogenesis GTPase A
MDEKVSCSSHVRKVDGNICTPEALKNILNTEKWCLESTGANYGIHIQRLEELEKRLSQGRFHLAVLGQVKRGKSTFINALLGEEVLPSSVIPLTAIPNFHAIWRTARATYTIPRWSTRFGVQQS